MTVTLSFYGEGMRGIMIDGNGETPEYLDEVKQKLGVIIFSEERVDVDVIAGATLGELEDMTSEILDADWREWTKALFVKEERKRLINAGPKGWGRLLASGISQIIVFVPIVGAIIFVIKYWE